MKDADVVEATSRPANSTRPPRQALGFRALEGFCCVSDFPEDQMKKRSLETTPPPLQNKSMEFTEEVWVQWQHPHQPAESGLLDAR